MKISNGIASVLLAGTLGLLGCNGANTVTGVDEGGGTRFAQSLQKVINSPASLSGLWKGTIVFHAYNNLEGDSAPSPCEGTEAIGVALSQNGERLTGHFESGCAGTLEIQGVVIGAQVSGTLASASGPGFGRIFGTVSSGRIRFRTVQTTDDEDDNGRDNDGDSSFTSTDVDLSPAPSTVRLRPLVAESTRSPRALAPRR